MVVDTIHVSCQTTQIVPCCPPDLHPDVCVQISEARVIVGRLEINSLDNLVRIGGTSGGAGGNTPSVCDVDIDTSSESGEKMSVLRRKNTKAEQTLLHLNS